MFLLHVCQKKNRIYIVLSVKQMVLQTEILKVFIATETQVDLLQQCFMSGMQ